MLFSQAERKPASVCSVAGLETGSFLSYHHKVNRAFNNMPDNAALSLYHELSACSRDGAVSQSERECQTC